MTKQQLTDDMKVAMREKDADRLTVIRMVLSAIKNEEINARGELTDEQLVAVLSREAKRRKDSITAYETGGRPELAEQERKELALIQTYLPAQVSDNEIRAVLLETREKIGATGPADLGKLMGAAMSQLKGKADGNDVRRLATELLQS